MKYFLIFTLLLLAGCQQSLEKEQICFQENCFNVEVAETETEQAQGLMNRSDLNENAGMLFSYQDEAERTIWMKNMQFPIDIVWLDKNYQVVYLKKNVQPCTKSFCPLYKANQLAHYVLELPAGTAEKINLKIGDSLDFS